MPRPGRAASVVSVAVSPGAPQGVLLTGRPAFDHERHLAVERLRLLDALGTLLRAQRDRGRTPAADALAGMVIEDGEAEGLLRDLGATWRGPHAPASADGGSLAERREALERQADMATATGVPLPLWRARRMFGLRPDEYDALVLALLVEGDARAGRLVAYLNDHVAQARPTAGLVQALAGVQGIGSDPLTWLRRPVLADGLLTLEGTGPVPTRELHLDQVQARRLTSLDAAPHPGLRVAPADPALLGRLVLAQALRERVERWATGVRRGAGPPVVVVTGAAGSGRTTLARAAAGAAGRPFLEAGAALEDAWAELRLLRREARWYGAAVAVRLGPRSPNGAALWEALGAPPDLVFVEAGEDQVGELIAAAHAEPALWHCDPPRTAARVELWHRAMPPGMALPGADAEALAGAFRFGPAAIARAVRRADAGRGTRALDGIALAAAARDQVGEALGRLADRLPLPYRRQDLVLPAETDRELDLAINWIRHQAQVLDRWGLGRRVASGRGLTVLFAGPPGTGKTMAAQVLSHELGLDLLPHRPVPGRQQVHRGDREEPRPALRRGARRAAPSCSSTRRTRCSASAPRSATRTTATPTSRSATCCSAWSSTTAWRCWRPTGWPTWTRRSCAGSNCGRTLPPPRGRRAPADLGRPAAARV